MKYRKKPVVIEAHLFDGDFKKAFEWEQSLDNHDTVTYLSTGYDLDGQDPKLFVNTLEGTMLVPVGNYIICGVQGELYSCAPAIFNKTYEPVLNQRQTSLAKIGILPKVRYWEE